MGYIDVKRIKQLLRANRMTYNDLAEVLTKNGEPTSEAAIKSWFVVKNPSRPSIKKLDAISKIFNKNIEYFLKKNDFKNISKPATFHHHQIMQQTYDKINKAQFNLSSNKGALNYDFKDEKQVYISFKNFRS